MITRDGYIDWAKRIDGIPDKIYSQPNSGEWITCHSIVGQESEFEDGIPNRFLDTSKLPDGSYTANAAASCMFILRRNGTLIQMYPVTASTWTSGGREANTRSWAIEAEGGLASSPGGYGELLTPEATRTFTRLVREWEGHTGRKAVSGVTQAASGVTLKQHKDVAREFGYSPTACASDRYRIAWEAATVQEAEDMADRALATVLAELLLSDIKVVCDENNAVALGKALGGIPGKGKEYTLNTAQALIFATEQGMRFWLGLQQTQARIGALEAK